MHQLHYQTAPENCNKSLIEGELNELCERESDWGSGLPYPIKWVDRTFESYDEAMKWIEDHDSSYAQIAVKYRSYPKLDKSKKYEDINAKLIDTNSKYSAISSAFHFKDHASAYIGCKNCGSKISHEYLKSNYCPVCRNDLRPESTLARIQTLKAKTEDLRKALKEEETRLQAKQAKSSVVRWLIKIEYHC